jgi:hypothetical protein
VTTQVTEQLVAELLAHQERRSLFVGDVVDALRRRNSLTPPEVEHAIRALAERGKVLVRDHVSGDPHLDDADLRVVGLLNDVRQGDATAEAVAAVEATWMEWLAEFLSNHRCG